MRNYIIISKEQADRVRGRHGEYSALEPVMFPDGMFAIPERCLDDPEFADIKKTLEDYRKTGIVQDIVDLNEKALTTAVQKDKYYLSKDYWVVKALTSEVLSISTVDKLIDLPDKFLIREDIAALVDAKKDAIIEEPKPKSLFAQVWDGIKSIWNSFFG